MTASLPETFRCNVRVLKSHTHAHTQAIYNFFTLQSVMPAWTQNKKISPNFSHPSIPLDLFIPVAPLHTPSHPSTPLHTPPHPFTALHTSAHPFKPLHPFTLLQTQTLMTLTHTLGRTHARTHTHTHTHMCPRVWCNYVRSRPALERWLRYF